MRAETCNLCHAEFGPLDLCRALDVAEDYRRSDASARGYLGAEVGYLATRLLGLHIRCMSELVAQLAGVLLLRRAAP